MPDYLIVNGDDAEAETAAQGQIQNIKDELYYSLKKKIMKVGK